MTYIHHSPLIHFNLNPPLPVLLLMLLLYALAKQRKSLPNKSDLFVENS